jgi:hypothetical protein
MGIAIYHEYIIALAPKLRNLIKDYSVSDVLTCGKNFAENRIAR